MFEIVVAEINGSVIRMRARKKPLHIAKNRFQPDRAGAGMQAGKYLLDERRHGRGVFGIDGRKHSRRGIGKVWERAGRNRWRWGAGRLRICRIVLQAQSSSNTTES